jgi:hypothetical protein
MCNATPQQKPVLNIINSMSNDEIQVLLSERGFELSCMLQHGLQPDKLNSLDPSLLKLLIEKEGITKEKLQEAGMTHTMLDSVFGSSNTLVCSQCNQSFASDQDFNNYKAYCTICNNDRQPEPPPGDEYEKINRNDISMPVSLIKNYLKGGELTREGLRNNCGLIDEVIERIEGFERVSMSDDVDVSSLPPLEKDRTDFYLIGMPGAGKSCMIASLLAYWEHKGYYNPDVNNPRSIEYTDLLMRPFEKGYLPDRTESNFIDYINLSLNVRIQSRNLLGRINNHTRSIPVNILDMAGEAWRLAAEKGSGLPDHRAYLDNKNEKSIIIVMDNSASISVQSQNIVRIFRYFKDWGVLRNTTSIAVAVTKADLLGSDYSKLGPKVEELIDKKCANLKARLEEFENEFNLSVEYIPYSIGECRWGPFLMDPEFDSNVLLRSSAEKMTSYILESTAGFKSGGLGSIFSN